MNTRFKILWVEDDRDWLDAKKEDVSELLEVHVLEPVFVCKTGDDVTEGDYKAEDLDLILMDYNLEEDTKGDSIIKDIRESKVLTDIVFYSSDVVKMRQALKDGIPLMDGVYLAERKDSEFKSRVNSLISKIVRRSEDVVNLRGVVLDNTSLFETRIETMLVDALEVLDDTEKKSVYEKLYDEIKNNAKGINKFIENDELSYETFIKQNENHFVVNTNNRLNVLDLILDHLKNNHGMDKIEKIHDDYYDKIGCYRNKLGHADAEAKVIKIKGNVIEINQELHRMLRKNITQVDKNLSYIEKYLSDQR